MAAEKAAELMAFYDIEASELSVRSARAIKQTVSARKYGKSSGARLASGSIEAMSLAAISGR